MLLRPRSLLHLVVLAFILVLAPLAVLLLSTLHTLEQVSVNGRMATQTIVVMAQHSQSLPENLLEMERSARQFQVLGDAKLRSLFLETAAQMQRDLSRLCPLSAHSPARISVCTETTVLLASLQDRLGRIPHDSPEFVVALDDFALLRRNVQHLVLEIQARVERTSEQLAAGAETLKTQLVWQGIILVLLSLLLGVLFTFLIIRPIHRLEAMIQTLGVGDRVADFTVGGPRELDHLGQKLNWLQSRLQALEQQKVSFIRQMSHELKTPLASLREGADLLDEGLPGTLSDAQQEIVAILQDKSLQLQRMIENLLDFNAVNQQHELQLVKFDFNRLLREVLFDYRLDLQRSQVMYCIDGEQAMLLADRAKVRTILSNLISNAIYYSLPPRRIWLQWHIVKGFLHMTLANSGRAIAIQEQARIFLPFVQGSQKRSGTIKGSGIGLATALECVNLHGGSLSLCSHPQAEVCFELVLPLVAVQQQARPVLGRSNEDAPIKKVQS